MATKDNDSCHAKALPDEELFTLMARDPHAPALVRAWANKRQFEIDNDMRSKDDQAGVDEALECARKMVEWREKNDGKWREPQPVPPLLRMVEELHAAFGRMPLRVTKCEDGVLMIHTDGDSVCFGDPNHVDPPDDRILAIITDILNELRGVRQ